MRHAGINAFADGFVDGLTQRALAERIGAPQPVIARLEAGRQPVAITLLAGLADAVSESWSVSFAPPVDEPLASARSKAG